jgi:hypothetical protein
MTPPNANLLGQHARVGHDLVGGTRQRRAKLGRIASQDGFHIHVRTISGYDSVLDQVELAKVEFGAPSH